MHLCRLQVIGVRNLRDVRIEPGPGLNVIAGDNGAGKTSLLESIHLLATGHSFRTRQLAPLLARGADAVQITARVQGPAGTPSYPVGIRKTQGETLVRIRGRCATGLAELARELPVLAIHPESHVLVAGPPGQRRAFLDWGAFHREPDFQGVWQRYRRLLQQRNAALRAGGDLRQLSAWDESLAMEGEHLDDLRRAYLDVLKEGLAELGQDWRAAGTLESEYRRGWPEGQRLGEALSRNLARDRGAGFTHAGPHRAEVIWRLDERVAAEVASRGQQKTLVIMLRLAQARVLKAEKGRAPVMLVDDLPSELDATHREQVMGLLRALETQVFVTAIDARDVDVTGWAETRMFHVEHGRVSTPD
ncbi:DNA replication/repair protein RecF [Thioalkalivibrio thiocyanodenitrificans]|uniref:DNA replication/repair protein RecF n=1 Tax=Thioalkalivibrio thiocyanodenitrificans TaxID=243063 RepID=UPI000378E833|nr:DNA replication/repair protein RecF [Thioalkalivibrio thiocyanodenitrificans]